jgi:hypothetical protein
MASSRFFFFKNHKKNSWKNKTLLIKDVSIGFKFYTPEKMSIKKSLDLK